MINRVNELRRACEADNIMQLMQAFRSSPVSAVAVLNMYIPIRALERKTACTYYLRFHQKFEELSGLRDTHELPTLNTRLALNSLWADIEAQQLMLRLMSVLQKHELREFAARHNRLGPDLVSTAEKLAEWCVDSVFAHENFAFSRAHFIIGAGREIADTETNLSRSITELIRRKQLEHSSATTTSLPLQTPRKTLQQLPEPKISV